MGRLLFHALAIFLALPLVTSTPPPPLQMTDKELSDFAKALRAAEDPKIKAGVKLNYQGHTTSQSTADTASELLFKFVDVNILRLPTFTALIQLLDNFTPQVGIPEKDTEQVNKEVVNFIDTVFASKTWTVFTDLLRKKNHPLAKNPATLKNAIKILWFDHYSRAKGVPDSSAFEHIFSGELKNGEVSGLHNWVTLYQRERNWTEEFDYKGFIVKRFDLMATAVFSWHNQPKKTGSFFIGTSPEFDLALFTACFLARPSQDCNVDLDGCPVNIVTHSLDQNGRTFIGSAYPNIGPMTDECKRTGPSG
ncbi:Protein K02A11.3 [Aphelenchoides avenae]|nr:Protein K02A11.3 [Aphelenchus avenae]